MQRLPGWRKPAGIALIWLTPALWGQTQPTNPPRTPEEPKPEPVISSITVAEKLTAEAPASITVLDTPKLQRIPGVNLDDRLRMVPGFSLFRRNSSLVAHPTTQGLSLRGIGSSGASRTLVLWDGMPVNDPFGGWIYWTRIAPEDIGRVEVSRGASTSVFGDRALGGAVALFSREPEKSRVTAGYEFGNRNTHIASAGGSHLWNNRIGLSANGRAFTTDGYYIIPEANRGAIDRQANVQFTAANVRFDVLGARQRFFLRSDVMVEDRGNGTPIQRNSTSLGSIGANYARTWQRDTLSLVGFHTREEFRSGFSTILNNRTTERLTSNQTVPAEGAGGSALWRHTGSRWNMLAGTDALRVEGSSIDRFPTITRIGSGSQFQHGRFLQGDAAKGIFRFYAGARHHVPGSGRQFFSPSAGMTAGKGAWRARGSVYRSLRAPTLNELYRDFRAGNAVTQANPNLKPESIFGAEAGLEWNGETTHASFTAFRNDLRDIVGNVTLSTSPTEIIRQRQNTTRALAKGVEFDMRQRWRGFTGEGAYLFVDSPYSTGPLTPQVPRHQGSAQLSWQGKNTWLSGGVRSSGAQFEDDLNRFLLPGFTVAHVSLRQQLWRGFSAQLVTENLFNKEFVVGFSPTPLIGAPRLVRAGLRWDGRIF